MRQEIQVPRKLGEYSLIAPIERGGMGELFLASQQGLTKPCVVKVLLPKFSRDPQYRRRFFREAKILAGLRHGRIVPVIDFGEDKGFLYLVMEFIDGVNLQSFFEALARGGESIPPEMIAYIIGEVLEALRHAHERTVGGHPRGVIHRDVKPSNVLVTSEGEVLLTDFGIARYEAEMSAEMFGTIAYMAPEQALGTASFQSDLYSASGLVHYMLTGEAPRRARNIAELHATLGAPAPGTGRGDVPEPVERLRVLGLEPDVALRLESARSGLMILEAWHGYRKQTTLTAELYERYVGPRRSGMTKLNPAAKDPGERGIASGERGIASVVDSTNAPSSSSAAAAEANAARTVKVESVGPGVVGDSPPPSEPPPMHEPAVVEAPPVPDPAVVAAPSTFKPAFVEVRPTLKPTPVETPPIAAELSQEAPSPIVGSASSKQNAEHVWKPWWESDEPCEEAKTTRFVEPDAPRLFRRRPNRNPRSPIHPRARSPRTELLDPPPGSTGLASGTTDVLPPPQPSASHGEDARVMASGTSEMWVQHNEGQLTCSEDSSPAVGAVTLAVPPGRPRSAARWLAASIVTGLCLVLGVILATSDSNAGLDTAQDRQSALPVEGSEKQHPSRNDRITPTSTTTRAGIPWSSPEPEPSPEPIPAQVTSTPPSGVEPVPQPVEHDVTPESELKEQHVKDKPKASGR